MKSISWIRDRSELGYRITDDLNIKAYKHGTDVRADFVKAEEKKTSCISLIITQFVTLFHINPLILSAIKHKHFYEYDLGEMVKFAFSEYRNKWTVNLRGYYIDDSGETKPGKWGVHICPTVWLRSVTPKLEKIRE